MTIRRSVAASVVGRYSSIVIQLGTSIVLARLIPPSEFGVYGIVVAVVGLSSAIRELGISNYLVQLPQLDRESVARATGIMLTTSVLCAFAIFSTREWIAEVYHEPRLDSLIAIAGVGFLLLPLGLRTTVALQRELQFATLMTVSLASTVFGSLIAIFLAFQGWGAFALVWAQLAMNGSTVLVLSILRPANIICWPRFRGWGSMLGFGVFSMLSSLAYQCQSSIVTMMIGRGFGFTAVGLYERAGSTVQYVGRELQIAVMGVVYVGLSKAKGNSSQLSWFAQASLARITGVLVPLYLLAAVLAEKIVLVLYGSAWIGAAPVIQVLAVGAAVGTFGAVHARALMALGRMRDVCGIEWALLAFRIALILIFLPLGLLFVAGVQAVVSAIATMVYIGFANKSLSVSIGRQLAIFLQASALGVSTALPAYIVRIDSFKFNHIIGGAIWELAFCLGAGSLGWYLTALALKHPLVRDIHGFLRLGGVGR